MKTAPRPQGLLPELRPALRHRRVIEQEKSLLVANAELFCQQFAIDSRTQCEAIAIESVSAAVNTPLGQLRGRLAELPRDCEIRVICRSGQRAYCATRTLAQKGFQASVAAGGVLPPAGPERPRANEQDGGTNGPTPVGSPLRRLDESDIGQSGQITGTSTRLTARKSSINGRPTFT
jgi:rhodanese-related sulfurtransferase